MIYGNINVKETEAAYTPMIRKALEIIRTTDVTNMHHGKGMHLQSFRIARWFRWS